VLAAVASATLSGATGRAASVEVLVSNGLPGFTIVGLPDATVREARDRVRAAVLSSGLPWPQRRVTVNLDACKCSICQLGQDASLGWLGCPTYPIGVRGHPHAADHDTSPTLMSDAALSSL
jgi:hypothetical protein